MKRSEMLHRSADRLDQLGADAPNYSFYEVAEELLKVVELNGMESPAYLEHFGVSSHYINEWEPEDET